MCWSPHPELAPPRCPHCTLQWSSLHAGFTLIPSSAESPCRCHHKALSHPSRETPPGRLAGGLEHPQLALFLLWPSGETEELRAEMGSSPKWAGCKQVGECGVGGFSSHPIGPASARWALPQPRPSSHSCPSLCALVGLGVLPSSVDLATGSERGLGRDGDPEGF